MNKPVFGLVLGAALGVFDGLTAWFTPQVRSELMMIVVGSMMKGLVAGVLTGYFAKKVNSLPLGIAFGLGVGLFLAYLVAMQPDAVTGEHYYWQIMLPGSAVGAIVGYATQKFTPGTRATA